MIEGVSLNAIVWGQPLWLFALVVPLMLALMLIVRVQPAAPRWHMKHPWAHALETPEHPSFWKRRIVIAMQNGALAALILALAQPQSVDEWIEPPPIGRDIALVIDVSDSMTRADQQINGRSVTRIESVRLLLTQLVQQRPADRFSLMVYGEGAAELMPPTTDRMHALWQIQRVQASIMGDGTALGDAIALAVRKLKHRELTPAIVLIGDGDTTSQGQVLPAEALAAAVAAQVKIHALQFNEETQAAPTEGSSWVNAEPDFSDLARLTGGSYRRAASIDDGLMFLNQIQQSDPTVRPEPETAKFRDWTLVALAASLILWWLSWLLSLPWPPSSSRRLMNSIDPHLQPWVLSKVPLSTAEKFSQVARLFTTLALLALCLTYWPNVQKHVPQFLISTTAEPTAPANRASLQGLNVHWLVHLPADMKGSLHPTIDALRTRMRQISSEWTGERHSLIAVGTEPTWMLPPTRDAELMRWALDRLHEQRVTSTQWATFSKAVELAQTQMQDPSASRHAMLMILDVTNKTSSFNSDTSSLLRAGMRMKSQATPVFVVANGEVPEHFQQLAQSSGGAFVNAGNDLAGLLAFYATHVTQGDWQLPEDQPTSSSEFRIPSAWMALTAWLMIVAMGITQKNFLFSAIWLAVWFSISPAQAKTLQPPLQPLSSNGAAGGYGFHWNQAHDAMQAKRFDTARQELEMAWMLSKTPNEQANALYNLGHAMASMNRWDVAAQTWEAVLKVRPKDAQAQYNLNVAREQLERQRQQGGVLDLHGRRGFSAQGMSTGMHTDNVPELETLPGGDTAGESSVASQAKARSRLNTHLNTPALSYQLNEAHIRSSRLKVERLTEQDNTLHLQLMKRQWKPVQPPLLKEPTNQSPKDMLP